MDRASTLALDMNRAVNAIGIIANAGSKRSTHHDPKLLEEDRFAVLALFARLRPIHEDDFILQFSQLLQGLIRGQKRLFIGYGVRHAGRSRDEEIVRVTRSSCL